MEKVRKYSSFEAMKDATQRETVSEAVRAQRHKRFESFIDFLRGDNPPERSHQEKEEKSE